MNKLEITKITLDDFKALNLTGYAHRKHYYNSSGQKVCYEDTLVTVPAMEIDGATVPAHVVSKPGCYSKICWEAVSLSDLATEMAEQSIKARTRLPLVIAIHRSLNDEEILKVEQDAPTIDLATGRPLTSAQKAESLKFLCLYEESYLDKWLTPSGAQTYLCRCGVEHLYSTRDYFETRDDYFKVKKKDTQAVYLISI